MFFLNSLCRARMANSQDLEYSNNNIEALNLLNKYEYIAEIEKNKHLDYYFIRARLKYKLHYFDEALRDVFIAEKVLIENEESFSEVDLLYLKKYMNFLFAKIYHTLNNPLWEKYDKLYEDINYNFEKDEELNQLFEQWLPLPS